MLLLKGKLENLMEKVTLGCRELQDSRVCQVPQVFLGLLAHLAHQDSWAFQEPWDLQDPRVIWAIM